MPSSRSISEPEQEVSQENRTQLNVDIPESLHEKSKTESVESDREMREIAVDISHEYL
ncbi:hypothetical protein GGP81_002984 [Salinibacter ruber]|jgi:hypothetical protein|uniref:Uncharacterized protein n=1 Tax=Salinibacter ruber TaxID=146919 RepID=A0A9X2UH11_9BACT|nr:hypothetical protein [Salinibacter ruber]MCS3711281.1 hypothetical protein [Salinibacter ruber]MCS3952793.1 hypothetical protein [Salinibacter ruber]MCS3956443.1 hypothetical protein [Salinibacter ruber]MCS4034522.1 hypothetical protein [Salinibacter ruber]